ncbi:uncharacterized protein LOC135940929 [Cloeon dipterum]|uniref:uncharacterized protein LOC135940929 n=1 Tax=Cloeon dipterum TaxID=197152 RepID=UPI00322018C1
MASLPKEMLEVLQTVLQKQNLTLEKHSLAAGCKPGDNFIGEILKVTALGRDENGAQREHRFVFKRPPADKDYCESLQVFKLVKNEEAFYTKVVPALNQFLQKNGKLEKLPVPDVFFSCSDGVSDVLVMEDLSLQGYKMANKAEGFTPQEVFLVLEKMGQLHGVALAMQELEPQHFFKVRNFIKEVYFFEEGRTQFSTIHFPCDAGVKMLEDRFPHRHDYVEKLKKVTDDFFSNLVQMVSTPTPLRVINHGDCWVNNILIKYEDGAPVDLRFLDFQIARFASLAHDLSYLLYCSCQKDTLDEHWDDFIAAYVSAVNDAIHAVGGRKSSVTKHQVEQEMKKFAKSGIMHALMAVPFFVAATEEQPKLEGGLEIFDNFHQNTYKNLKTRDRLTDMIVHAIEKGYL